MSDYTPKKPTRKRTESPVAISEAIVNAARALVVGFNGHYYCNPAHCHQKWKDKKARDAHLIGAYSILD